MKFCRCGTKYAKHCPRCSSGGHARTTTERGYGWDHQQSREGYVQAHPLCEACVRVGVLTANPTADLHHIEKITHAPQKRLRASNWLALCKSHHEQLEDDIPEARAVKRWSELNYQHAISTEVA